MIEFRTLWPDKVGYDSHGRDGGSSPQVAKRLVEHGATTSQKATTRSAIGFVSNEEVRALHFDHPTSAVLFDHGEVYQELGLLKNEAPSKRFRFFVDPQGSAQVKWLAEPSFTDYNAVENSYADSIAPGRRFVQSWMTGQVIDPMKLRELGGAGSGNHGHAGRKGQVGGSSKGSGSKNPYAPDDSESGRHEAEHQQQLADAQTDPLAHPEFVLGGTSIPHSGRYVAAYGERHQAAPLPNDVSRDTPGECYKNASMLVMSRPDLTYAEGFATTPATTSLSKAYADDLNKPGLTFQHAWAVDADGRVVDPTWDHPERNQYFGVKYDRKAYLKYLYKAKIYGVLGSTRENAKRAVTTGVPELRGQAKTLAEFRSLWPNKDGVDYHGRPPGSAPPAKSSKPAAAKPPAAEPEKLQAGFTRSSRPEELAAHSAATVAALDGKTATPRAIMSLKEDPAVRAALITKLGGESRAQTEYAHTPSADLAVLKSISVKNHPVQGQAHCTFNREVVMGSTSVSGDFRHELGHAVHMSMSPELQGRAKDLFTKAIAKTKADPAGLKQKLSHEFYEKTYGVIGRRGLDNWHENFAEHYRGYHKAVHQTKTGENAGALDRYASLHPEWNALWDARYSTIGGKQ